MIPERNGKPAAAEPGLPELSALELEQLANALTMLGCPAGKAPEMAAQLDKRARQLASLKQTSYEASLAHLLALMKQGWAAKEQGL